MGCKIACCQMEVTRDKENNLERAAKMVETAAQQGAELIVLPEMFQCPYENQAFPEYAEPENGKSVRFLAELSRKYQCILVGGSIPEQEKGHYYNTCFVFEHGNYLGKHQKYHLFDVNIPGKISFQESSILSSGEHFSVFSTSIGKIGVGICFDLRFPEQWIQMALDGAKLLICPAAFNPVTGPKHWDLLLRARAIDSQCFVAACSPAYHPTASYHAYGHSCVVSPWGEILQQLGNQQEILFVEIDLEQVAEVRQQIPILAADRFATKRK